MINHGNSMAAMITVLTADIDRSYTVYIMIATIDRITHSGATVRNPGNGGDPVVSIMISTVELESRSVV